MLTDYERSSKLIIAICNRDWRYVTQLLEVATTVEKSAALCVAIERKARHVIGDIASSESVNYHRPPHMETPLILATLMDDSDTVSELVGMGADIHAKDAFGKTAVSLAETLRHVDVSLALKGVGQKHRLPSLPTTYLTFGKSTQGTSSACRALGNIYSERGCSTYTRDAEDALWTALCMAYHPRLGSTSHLCRLPRDIMHRIAREALDFAVK